MKIQLVPRFSLIIILSVCSYHVSSHFPISEVTSNLKIIDNLLQKVIEYVEKSKEPYPGPIDCKHVQSNGNNKSGIYRIWPLNWVTVGSFLVYCDMEIDGGGWTVFQRRGDYKQPKDYFFKDWEQYSLGFGKLNEDFWLGNDKLFALTNQANYSLRIDMKDLEGNKRYAFYKEFWIENERQQYKLHVSGFEGDAGDSFSNLNGMKFTTKDKDNDIWNKNCAEEFKGGWWYSKCHGSNLNGLYLNGSHSTYADGIEWVTWKHYNYSLPEVNMKIRRINVFQRRGDYKQPKDYFFKDWEQYSLGFGKLNEDFWLGNDKIFALTNQANYSLRIDMKDLEGNKRYAFYKEFWIENERQQYKLHVSGFEGNAGDSFSNLNGMKFTTKDKDNDIWYKNCAEVFKGGWWYSKCHGSNLNGLYLNGSHSTYADGIEWVTWKHYNYSLPEVNMKIRRIN
ncbi:techylectin-5A-like [Centruroides sculpturatus]|uniref:techylectin-5A-like n=1 Tax=Centruroides sculpturatus TaxID=218467 RepID=UPI000C6EA55C|nr:techylectin-5A-like [Centruroides sculpturatus]